MSNEKHAVPRRAKSVTLMVMEGPGTCGTCFQGISRSHASSKYQATRSRVLIVFGIRHFGVVCHCFPRRLYFGRVLRNLATLLELGGHRGQ
ncbi:hypothetical protein PoB_003030600 [Plakobranchus ocellatus]|uniref:Uncharacterized protein n=1 Tax=Plakobranchus ocellatus TaxID=259542 RepID=A0AAV4A6A3_9GAST|nr:hypothetical protein PoB_003030600 [Plakobranchus ocellatus]